MPKNSTHRVRALRDRARAADAAAVAGMAADEITANLSSALDLLSSSGLPAPSREELAAEAPADRALAIGRILGAAGKALELARRRGELVSGREAQAAMVGLASAVRAALDRAPAYLPSSLEPEAREMAEAAMATAIGAALATLAPPG